MTVAKFIQKNLPPQKKTKPNTYKICLGSKREKNFTALGMLRKVNKARAHYAPELKPYTLKNWQEGWCNFCEGGQVDERGYQKDYLGFCQQAVNEYFTSMLKGK